MNKRVQQSDVAEATRPAPPGDDRDNARAQPRAERKTDVKSEPARREPNVKEAQGGDSRRTSVDESHPSRKSFWTRNRIIVAGVGAAILLLIPGLWLTRPNEPKISYTLTKAAYGTVMVSVRTSGTLAPRDSVDVPTETGGQVQTIAVRSGDRVVKGQVLARLQSPALNEELLRVQTAFAFADANVKQADSETVAARAAASHLPASASAAAERDVAQARISRAVAEADKLRVDLHAAELRVAAVRAQIAKLDVRAPADGIVLKRSVEPGTRARLAQGQGMFTLISGLSPLNLAIDVPEAELGSVRAGETAEFTVPAFQGRTFSAVVSAIDLLPKKESTETGMRITYPGTLEADNSLGLLRPGMTASVVIIVARATNVLVVPNGAFSFAPPKSIAEKYPPLRQPGMGARMARVWVMKGGNIEPRDIKQGLSDGQITEIASGPLRPGESVVTGSVMSVRGETAR